MIGPPDQHRLRVIYAEPTSATTAEVLDMAQELYTLRKVRGAKTLRDEFAMAALTGLLAHGDKDDAVDCANAFAESMMATRP